MNEIFFIISTTDINYRRSGESMADFKYTEKQEKIIEKKNAELNDKTKKLLQDSKINQIKKKYKDLVKRKKAGTLNWMDEEKLEIYKDAIELEKKKD